MIYDNDDKNHDHANNDDNKHNDNNQMTMTEIVLQKILHNVCESRMKSI